MRRVLTTLMFAALLLAGAAAGSVQSGWDVLIQGARLLDGTGNPWIVADVALASGRIAAIGRSLPRDAASVIEAAHASAP